MEVEFKVKIDIDDAFSELAYREQKKFIAERLDLLDDGALVSELERRGFRIAEDE